MTRPAWLIELLGRIAGLLAPGRFHPALAAAILGVPRSQIQKALEPSAVLDPIPWTVSGTPADSDSGENFETGGSQGHECPDPAPLVVGYLEDILFSMQQGDQNAEPAGTEAFPEADGAETAIGGIPSDLPVHLAHLAGMEPGPVDPDRALNWARRLMEAGALDGSAGVLTALARRLHPDRGGSPEAWAAVLSNLGLVRQAQGRLDEAMTLAREVVDLDARTKGRDHPEYAAGLANLASCHLASGSPAAAEPLFREALGVDRASLGRDHPQYRMHLVPFAQTLRTLGRADEAENLFREALSLAERDLGPDHPGLLPLLDHLALTLVDLGEPAEANTLLKRSVNLTIRTLGPDHPDLAVRLNNWAGINLDLGRFDQAEELFGQALAICLGRLPADHPQIRTLESNLNLARRLRQEKDGA